MDCDCPQCGLPTTAGPYQCECPVMPKKVRELYEELDNTTDPREREKIIAALTNRGA